MLISKKTMPKNVKLLSLVVIALFIIAGGYLAAARYKHLWPFEAPLANSPAATIDYNPPTQEQKDLGQQTKDVITGNSKDQTPNQTDTGQTTGKVPVAMTITSANASGDTLSIRTSIDTLTSEGKCRLSMKGPSGKTYSAEADVQALAASTTCKGFNVPISSLSAGSWDITIVFENSTHTGSTSKTVEVN